MPPARAVGGARRASREALPPPRFYATSFTATESPISEGGKWNHTGTYWTNVATNGDLAFGTQGGEAPFTNGNQYDDSYAYLSGYGENHVVEVTIAINATITGANREVECLFRWADSSNTAQGYELMIPEPNASYNLQLVRWNGALTGLGETSFTYVKDTWSTTPPRPQNGDKFGGMCAGNTMTAWIKRAGSVIWTDTADLTKDISNNTISVLTGGNPGCGFFYRKLGGSSAATDFCISDFRAVAL